MQGTQGAPWSGAKGRESGDGKGKIDKREKNLLFSRLSALRVACWIDLPLFPDPPQNPPGAWERMGRFDAFCGKKSNKNRLLLTLEAV